MRKASREMPAEWAYEILDRRQEDRHHQEKSKGVAFGGHQV